MVSAVDATATAAAREADRTVKTDALSERETFLKLLVAQIRHQNPLEPADALQFVTQLAQFSELEQMIQMRQELAAIREELAGGGGPAAEAGAVNANAPSAPEARRGRAPQEE